MFAKFLGCTFAFAIALFGSAFLGDAGPILFGAGMALALLLLILLKLEQIVEKLSKLTNHEDENE